MIDYPLMPAVRMAHVVDACVRAVDWVARNAASFGGDPDRVFVSGNSAGGQLVAEVMDRDAGRTVRGGTAISGLYDLEPVTRSFQNDDLGADGGRGGPPSLPSSGISPSPRPCW